MRPGMKLDNERDILPTWVTSNDATGLPELNSVKKNKISLNITQSTPDILEEFKATQNIGVAVELLNVATIENDKHSATLAAVFLKENNFLPASIIQLIDDALGKPPPTKQITITHPIAVLKRQLYKSQNDPLLWADLSREYAILGDKERSLRAMLTALHLYPNHRWITRISARVFVHFDEPDRAHSTLLKNSNTRSDPWLIATEMAVSRKAKKQSKLLQLGKKFLESTLQPIHISELASSFATLELLNGAEKKAKNFFKQSLLAPNQNSLAQAKWAERNSGLKKLIKIPLNIEIFAYEAQYWEAYSIQNISLALEFAKLWYEQEPYSSRPAIAISYLASLLDDYDLVTQITTKGLIANPQNSTLKINQIFAWIASNDLMQPSTETSFMIDRALRTLNLIKEKDDSSLKAHAIANLGMLAYRMGDLEDGRKKYEVAEDIYDKNIPDLKIVLLVNHLREALISGAPWASEIMHRANMIIKVRNSSAIPGSEFYLKKIVKLSVQNGSWREKFELEGLEQSIANEICKLKHDNQSQTKIANLSKFWLPEDFPHIESIRTITNDPDKK